MKIEELAEIIKQHSGAVLSISWEIFVTDGRWELIRAEGLRGRPKRKDRAAVRREWEGKYLIAQGNSPAGDLFEALALLAGLKVVDRWD